MNIKRIVAAIVLFDFAALNVYALYTSGIGGFVEFLTTMGPWEYVIAADIVIALGMVVYWMWGDAKKRGRNPIPYTILTLGTGSIGTLLYVATNRGGEEVSGRAPRDATLMAS